MSTAGHRHLLDTYRLCIDSYDPWGSNMGWLFALAEVALWYDHRILPGYQPSPYVIPKRAEMIEYGYEYSVLFDMLDDDAITQADIDSVYTILNRYDAWLRLAGRDY